MTRYPEPDAATLKRLLARRYEIKEENIVVTNGSITAFYLLAQAWRGAKSMIAIPSFSEYEDACRLHEHEISFFPTSDDLSELSLEGQDFCWIVIRISGWKADPPYGASPFDLGESADYLHY